MNICCLYCKLLFYHELVANPVLSLLKIEKKYNLSIFVWRILNLIVNLHINSFMREKSDMRQSKLMRELLKSKVSL